MGQIQRKFFIAQNIKKANRAAEGLLTSDCLA